MIVIVLLILFMFYLVCLFYFSAKSTRSKNNEKSSDKHSEENDLVSPADQSGIVGTDVKAEDHGTDDLVNLDAR